MDRLDRSLREHRYPSRPERENPSFSSTLLDAIYRSIDEGDSGRVGGEGMVVYRETAVRKKKQNCTGFEDDDEDMARLRRVCLIEKWMEKKVTEKVVLRRRSMADFVRKPRSDEARDPWWLTHSSSSSSDSSSGGGFSSSEAESMYGAPPKPKPIRTSLSAQPEKFNKQTRNELKVYDRMPHQDQKDRSSQLKPKHENGFAKTKSKALKIYGDLKKAKQPISPGGRLASFLNSLFTTGSAKKAKISTPAGDCDEMTTSETKSKSAYVSTSSSASSFSRSCLSKTPSSRGKLSGTAGGAKRSVRFCPVNVIVDEDCQPCRQKSLYNDDNIPSLEAVKYSIGNSIKEEVKINILEKNRRVEEVARDLLKKYHKSFELEREIETRNVHGGSRNMDEDDYDDEEDDAASYASSDLFELDNLSAIGIDRYREELPVYETTHLGTNRAIANGMIP